MGAEGKLAVRRFYETFTMKRLNASVLNPPAKLASQIHKIIRR
jgi:hypothetical protein